VHCVSPYVAAADQTDYSTNFVDPAHNGASVRCCYRFCECL